MGKKHKAIASEIITAKGPWREVLLVCRKCDGKLKGGWGDKGKDDLAGAFKDVLRARGQRRAVRILEVGCLGICPKDAVTVVRGAAPGEMLVVPQGLDLQGLADRLNVAALPAAV